jgi:SAM-dependent methyltransferase
MPSPAGRAYDTDKLQGYVELYEPLLRPFEGQDVRLLELGVRRGGSLLLWRDWFPRGTIVGLDLAPVTLDDPTGRIRVYQGDQADTALLSRIAGETAPDGFDIIIDDASHLAAPTRVSFWHLFDRHLRPGGLYVIEDWGTGYWDSWPDGRCHHPRPAWRTRLLCWLHARGLIRGVGSDTHAHGMVGLVKELIDEQGREELTRRRLGGVPERPSKFAQVLVTGKLVAVWKSNTSPTHQQGS